jgi:Uma2 family endonuclease
MNEAVMDPPKPPETMPQPVRLRLDLTDEQFFEMCQVNSDLHFERTAQGEIIIMPPTGWGTDDRNGEITRQLGNWTRQDGRGRFNGSSAGFKLPNGADRSPDGAWVSLERLRQLTPEQRQKFLPLCPDFAIELRSPTDNIEDTKAKMEEYLANGLRLGWLIDPPARRVYIYRPGREVEILENPAQVSGDPELPGFVLEMAEIWEPSI